jgi:Tol biopolymer transport system component
MRFDKKAWLALLVLLAVTLITAGCGSTQLEMGLKQPAELTATAQALAGTQPRPGKLAFVHGGDIWARQLPDGTPERLTQDGQNMAPRWSASGDWLAFTKRSENAMYVMRADGSALRSVTGATDGNYAWSPTGDELAFQSAGGLSVEAADGANRRNLVPVPDNPETGAGVHAFAWSADGKRIAYQKMDGLWIVNADGSGATQVLKSSDPSAVQYELAGWAPGDQALLYWQGQVMSASLLADGAPLMRVPLESGQPVEIAKAMLLHTDFLTDSPDGQSLAFVDGERRETWRNKAIAVSGPDGSAKRLSDADRTDLFPAWSPDSRQIVYASGPATDATGEEATQQALNQRRIWVMAADGTGKRALTNDPSFRDEHPGWSTDGSSILFARIQGERAQVWLMRADGSGQRQVADDLTPNAGWFGNYGYIDWSQLYDWWPGAPAG